MDVFVILGIAKQIELGLANNLGHFSVVRS